MAIEFACSCGRALNLRDELAGKHIKCPKCSATLLVPGGVEVVKEVAAGAPPVAAGGRRDRDDDDYDDDDSPRRGSDTPKERRKKEKEKKKKKSVFADYYGDEGKSASVVAFNEGWFGNMASGIVGGVLTLLIGIILLTLCILFWASMYGILASIFFIVVGLGATLKGLMDLY